MESDGSVYKVSYNGKSDIADPDLKPVQKMKLPDPQASTHEHSLLNRIPGVTTARQFDTARAVVGVPLTPPLTPLSIWVEKR